MLTARRMRRERQKQREGVPLAIRSVPPTGPEIKNACSTCGGESTRYRVVRTDDPRREKMPPAVRHRRMVETFCNACLPPKMWSWPRKGLFLVRFFINHPFQFAGQVIEQWRTRHERRALRVAEKIRAAKEPKLGRLQ
jgi:hypothetical protein